MSLVDSNMPYLGTIWLAGALACLDSLARTRLSLSWHSCLLFSLAEKETIGTDIIMNKRQDRFPGLPGQSPHCSFIIKFSSLLRCWPEKINIFHFNMEACWYNVHSRGHGNVRHSCTLPGSFLVWPSFFAQFTRRRNSQTQAINTEKESQKEEITK